MAVRLNSQLDSMSLPLPGQRLSARGESAVAWHVGLMWLVVAVSSIVFIEPAPYDLLAAGSLAAFLVTGMRIPGQLAVPVLLLIVFLLGNCVASLVAADPAGTLKALGIRMHLCATVLLFACAVASAPQRMLRALWHGYAIAALIATAWAAMQYFGWLSSPGEFRAQGPFKDPNVYGPFLVPIALYAVDSLWQRRGATRWGWLGLFLVTVFGILVSFSRGAWLNLVVSATVYLALKILTSRSARERIRLMTTGLMLFVAVAGFVSSAVTSTPFREQFVQRARVFHEYDLEPGGRFDAQLKALQTAGRQPLGIGPGRSVERFGREPHNLYLHVISEGGWIAAFGFYACLGLTLVTSAALLRSEWALKSQLHILVAALIGTLVQSFFIDSTHWRHLYLLLGVLWGLIVVRSRAPGGAVHG